jgi:anti-sigma B factor antagonist
VVVVTVFRVQCARVTARAATDVVLVVPPQVGRPLPLIDEITPLGDADPGSVVPLCDLLLYRAQMNSAFPSDTVDLRVAEHGSDLRVVTVTGEVDMVTAPELAACLIAQLAVAQVVVVNLDGVRFLASAGLTVLFEANELAKHKGRDLRLVCNSCTANRSLEATGLRKHLPFADNMPDALTN